MHAQRLFDVRPTSLLGADWAGGQLVGCCIDPMKSHLLPEELGIYMKMASCMDFW
jgi:hypothetical protein